MKNKRQGRILFGAMFFGLGVIAGNFLHLADEAKAQANRVFELRTYTANPGRLAELHTRFADHTLALFERHGMTSVGYFQPADAPASENTLVYLLAHDSRAAAEKSWEGFRNDPEWQRVAEESRRNGRLVANVESVFLAPMYYSPMK